MTTYGGDDDIFTNSYRGGVEMSSVKIAKYVSQASMLVLILISIIYMFVGFSKSTNFQAATGAIGVILPLFLGSFLVSDFMRAKLEFNPAASVVKRLLP